MQHIFFRTQAVNWPMVAMWINTGCNHPSWQQGWSVTLCCLNTPRAYLVTALVSKTTLILHTQAAFSFGMCVVLLLYWPGTFQVFAPPLVAAHLFLYHLDLLDFGSDFTFGAGVLGAFSFSRSFWRFLFIALIWFRNGLSHMLLVSTMFPTSGHNVYIYMHIKPWPGAWRFEPGPPSFSLPSRGQAQSFSAPQHDQGCQDRWNREAGEGRGQEIYHSN